MFSAENPAPERNYMLLVNRVACNNYIVADRAQNEGTQGYTYIVKKNFPEIVYVVSYKLQQFKKLMKKIFLQLISQVRTVSNYPNSENTGWFEINLL